MKLVGLFLLASIVTAFAPEPLYAAGETNATMCIQPGTNPRNLGVYDLSASRPCVPIGAIDSTAHTFSLLKSPAWFNVATGYGGNLANALAAAGTAGGGVVYIPGGTTVTVSGPVTPPANVCIYGDGYSSVISQTSAGSITINNVNNQDCYYNFLIKYVSQGTGPGGSSPVTGGIGIYTTASNTYLNLVYIVNAYIGFESHGANTETITNLSVSNSTYASIFLNSTANVVLQNINIGGTPNVGVSMANLYMYGSNQGIEVSDGEVYGGSGYSLYITGSTNAYDTFKSVFFDSGEKGSAIDSGSVLSFVQCWFSGGRAPGLASGLKISGGNSISISGGLFFNSGLDGIEIAGGTHISLTGNVVDSNNVENTNKHGIEVDPGVTDFTIIGNIATSSVVGYGTQKYGILVDAGASDRYTIFGNSVSGNATGGVSDGGTGSNKTVSGNY